MSPSPTRPVMVPLPILSEEIEEFVAPTEEMETSAIPVAAAPNQSSYDCNCGTCHLCAPVPDPDDQIYQDAVNDDNGRLLLILSPTELEPLHDPIANNVAQAGNRQSRPPLLATPSSSTQETPLPDAEGHEQENVDVQVSNDALLIIPESLTPLTTAVISALSDPAVIQELDFIGQTFNDLMVKFRDRVNNEDPSKELSAESFRLYQSELDTLRQQSTIRATELSDPHPHLVKMKATLGRLQEILNNPPEFTTTSISQRLAVDELHRLRFGHISHQPIPAANFLEAEGLTTELAEDFIQFMGLLRDASSDEEKHNIEIAFSQRDRMADGLALLRAVSASFAECLPTLTQTRPALAIGARQAIEETNRVEQAVASVHSVENATQTTPPMLDPIADHEELKLTEFLMEDANHHLLCVARYLRAAQTVIRHYRTSETPLQTPKLAIEEAQLAIDPRYWLLDQRKQQYLSRLNAVVTEVFNTLYEYFIELPTTTAGKASVAIKALEYQLRAARKMDHDDLQDFVGKAMLIVNAQTNAEKITAYQKIQQPTNLMAAASTLHGCATLLFKYLPAGATFSTKIGRAISHLLSEIDASLRDVKLLVSRETHHIRARSDPTTTTDFRSPTASDSQPFAANINCSPKDMCLSSTTTSSSETDDTPQLYQKALDISTMLTVHNGPNDENTTMQLATNNLIQSFRPYTTDQ